MTFVGTDYNLASSVLSPCIVVGLKLNSLNITELSILECDKDSFPDVCLMLLILNSQFSLQAIFTTFVILWYDFRFTSMYRITYSTYLPLDVKSIVEREMIHSFLCRFFFPKHEKIGEILYLT